MGPFFGLAGGYGQEGVREHGEGDVSMPGFVFADLVLVESDFVLGCPEDFLDGPAGAGHVDQFTESGAARVEAVVVGKFTVVD